jgi:hypothetical protein
MLKSKTVVLALFLTGAAIVVAAPAISATPAATAYAPPKNAFGQPDISGAWTNSTLTTLERAASYGERLVMTPEEVASAEGTRQAQIVNGNKPTPTTATLAQVNATCDLPGFAPGAGCAYNAGFTEPGDLVMRVRGKPVSSFITYPANGRIPPRKATAVVTTSNVVVGPAEGEERAPIGAGAAAGAGRGGAAPAATGGGGRGGGGGGRGLAGQFDNPENRPLPERCIMSFGASTGPIMRDQLYNSNYRFVQGRDSLAIWVEMVHDVRIVRIGPNVKHRTDGIRPYYGDAIGHYEGNSLVVETTNWPQSQQLAGSWQNLKITEKFTRLSPNRLLYEFKAEDPTFWDAPWGGEYEFKQTSGVYEYACHEGNYALEGVLAGARAAEKAATTPASAQR